jgi:ABC-2 type transport system ATP-binding protein
MVIKAINLSKRFGKTAALTDVSFSVPDGSYVILVGPNGAGKTTLLRILAGEFFPQIGNLDFGGKDKSIQTALAEENREFFKGFNAFKYRQLWGLLYPEFDPQTFSRLMTTMNLDLKKPVENFSKGMKTWLFNSLVISSNTPVMLFDEPLQHLDPSMRLKFHTEIKEEIAKGRSAIVSTHEITEFNDGCDRIAIINHSNLIYFDTIEKALFEHRVIPGTESVSSDNIIGPIVSEKVILTNKDRGRSPTLRELVTAYINGSDLSKN